MTTPLHHRHRSDQHKLTYYVSGPMRGIPRYNFPLFDSCAAWLRSEGYGAINPADHDREVDPDVESTEHYKHGDPTLNDNPHGGATFHDLLGWDLREIASPQCHGIVMLPGWETSTGAAHERYVAEACGKQVWLAHYSKVGNPQYDPTYFGGWYMTLCEDRLLSSFTADGLRKALKVSGGPTDQALSPTIHDPNHAMDRERLKARGWIEREPDTFVRDIAAVRSPFEGAKGDGVVGVGFTPYSLESQRHEFTHPAGSQSLQPTPTPVAETLAQRETRLRLYTAPTEYHSSMCEEGPNHPGPCHPQGGQIGQFQTKDSGERVAFDSGMVRDTQEGKPRFDLIPLRPLQRLAELYARGAVKYGDRNWQKANSADELQRFKASAWRHFVQFMQGDRDEDHGIAAVWNLFAALWLEEQLSPVPSVMEND